ncbi:radical SAM protein [bacterium]|nr:radical SAM protein [bacterium]
MANLAYIQLTRDCNQRCLFCSNPPVGKDELSFAQVKDLIDKYKKRGYDGLILSGGEPTVYPNLFKIIQYCSRINLLTRIITNGQIIAEKSYLNKLIVSGLNHLHLSIYSHQESVQNYLSHNNRSFKNLVKALKNLSEVDIDVSINITINKYNSDHLLGLVEFITFNFPKFRHFVFNNLDPTSKRVKWNVNTIPEFSDFYLELIKALEFLEKNNCSFRVENVPLCIMKGFEYASTETRKIVKNEIRPIYFLDDKNFKLQKDFRYSYLLTCKNCTLLNLCAGIFRPNFYKNYKIFKPSKKSRESIANKIHEK